MRLGGYSVAAIIAAGLMIGGCGDSSDSSSGGESSAPVKAEGGYIVGRVVGQDGKPIAVAEDIAFSVNGISEAGERVSYSPAVKPDGTYKQKLVPGSYRIGSGHVKIRAGDELFTLELTPEGDMWNKNRDAAEGIEQNSVWNMTGQRTRDKPDVNNHTHWYGMSVSILFSVYREDLKKSSTPPPEGSTVIFTLKPVSKLINGEDGKTLTIERPWRAKDITPIDGLNDLPPATYEISGVAKLPDGTTKPIVLQGPGDYPNFKPVTSIKLANDAIIGGIAKWQVGFAMQE